MLQSSLQSPNKMNEINLKPNIFRKLLSSRIKILRKQIELQGWQMKKEPTSRQSRVICQVIWIIKHWTGNEQTIERSGVQDPKLQSSVCLIHLRSPWEGRANTSTHYPTQTRKVHDISFTLNIAPLILNERNFHSCRAEGGEWEDPQWDSCGGTA